MTKMSRRYAGPVAAAILSACLSPVAGAAGDPVKIREESLVLPTYVVGAPDPNPRFYAGRIHQGARGRAYPYPMLDVLTDERQEKTYRAVYLENDYIKLCVLPELGGRLFSARDKTDGYDFFYRHEVIKPVLIGMLGAWISGGVEWNVPHHHRATTFMPVDYALQRHPDGSATLWVGELELRHRMRWTVGLTLHPRRSVITVTGRLYNRTPFANSILFWSNAAVHANDKYEVIFPPRTEYVTQHAKREFLSWPIAHGRYGGHFYDGVDIRWYKNLPKPVSFFAWNDTEDYFGGYDHGFEAGVVHVADHRRVPGKKFWTFASGPQGRMWDRMLSDTGAPYVELMAGAYSDNQPDYSWCQPYEVKSFRQFWFPVRNLGGFVFANTEGALNLTVEDGKALVRVNTTSPHREARVRLEAKGRILFEKEASIGPRRPFAAEAPLPAGVREKDLEVTVSAGGGRELMRYRSVSPPGAPKPEPVKPPPAPEKIKTVEELYLTGLRLEQFHSAARDPEAYYEEALKRDPGNARVNTRMGIRAARNGDFALARRCLEKAIERVTHDYTRPLDGEAYYYLGVTLEASEEYARAADAYGRAAWSAAWNAASELALARLDCRGGRFKAALEHADRSIRSNGWNPEARSLKAAILRHLGAPKRAMAIAARSVSRDPLDFRALNEEILALRAQGDENAARDLARRLRKLMRGNPQSYLELAVTYLNSGLLEEATDVLERAVDSAEPARRHPMIAYYLGYLWERRGDEAKARTWYKRGKEMSPHLCFPFRLESVRVLKAALKADPSDARAHYYLGNLFCDRQSERAISEWEKARSLEPDFAVVHRNLAFAYYHARKDAPAALASLDRALALNPGDPRFYYEWDVVAEAAGVPASKRLERLEAHRTVVCKRDDAAGRFARLYLVNGKYDAAVSLLTERHFHRWEGGGRIHDVFVDALTLRGRSALKAGRVKAATADFKRALTYPRNLEVGRPLVDRPSVRTYYFLGKAYRALGDSVSDRGAFTKALSVSVSGTEYLYYRGLTLRELGRDEDAQACFKELIDTGKARLKAALSLDFFAKFGKRGSRSNREAEAHYLLGLGYAATGERERACASFKSALQKAPTHVWARVYLNEITGGDKSAGSRDGSL